MFLMFYKVRQMISLVKPREFSCLVWKTIFLEILHVLLQSQISSNCGVVFGEWVRISLDV